MKIKMSLRATERNVAISSLCHCERSVAISYKECHYEERSDVVISYEKFISFYEIATLRSQ